jgi:alpha-mannosidase
MSGVNSKKINTIHMIGNAHIDPVWLWLWTEGYQETRATFRSALDRMKEFPEFVFTASQAAVYRWVEESDPEMFKEICQRVLEGRWVIVNGWWMEPDCNIPSGESFARQSLYGQRYFREKFGVQAKVGYCVDSFGHHGMLPQLLLQGGFDSYVFMRPNKIENPDIPQGPFWWESQDGSRILTYRLLAGYGTGGEDINPQAITDVSDIFFTPENNTHIRDMMFFYGVGNHGGGPTIENIRSIQKLQKNNELPQIEFSSPVRFFSDLRKSQPNLPEYRGEMQYHAAGCYSAHFGVKKWNRQAEHALQACERWSVISNLTTGMEYPREAISAAWKQVLFNQFHDILAGTSIYEAYIDVRDAYGTVMQVAKDRINLSIQRIASQVDTRGGDMAIIVYNSHAFPLTQVGVEVELMTWQLKGKDLILLNDKGEKLEWQAAQTSAAIPGGWRTRLCFLVDLPPMGYRTYHLNTSENKEQPKSGVLQIHTFPGQVVNGYDVTADSKVNYCLENEYLQFEVDGRLGDITQLIDKRMGINLIKSRGAVGVVVDDPSDTWSHGVTEYHNDCGRFSDAEVKIIEAGSVRTIIRAKTYFGKSTLVQDFILYKNTPWVEIRVMLEWHEHLKMLKLAFPVNIENANATFEIPYGTINRKTDGKEVPGLRWFDLTGENSRQSCGLSIINDASYSYDIAGNEMRMTVLRSPVYANHTPYRLESANDYLFMDQGVHEFRYIMMPHPGDLQVEVLTQVADILNYSTICLPEGIHNGIFPPSNGYCYCDSNNVNLSVIKLAEDNDDIVIRCYEVAGKKTVTNIHLPVLNRVVSVTLEPWQIKTLLTPRNADLAVRDINFLED